MILETSETYKHYKSDHRYYKKYFIILDDVKEMSPYKKHYIGIDNIHYVSLDKIQYKNKIIETEHCIAVDVMYYRFCERITYKTFSSIKSETITITELERMFMITTDDITEYAKWKLILC